MQRGKSNAMALMKESLWGIAKGTETAPEEGNICAKFLSRQDHALAIIVLSVEPSLLYLIGDPEDPVAVWKKSKDQLQKKSWANKLGLRRLYSLRLKEGVPVKEHIKQMTEIFELLSVIGYPIDEDQMVHLLASLLNSYNMR